MSDRTTLPLRVLRAGLRAASKVGADVADRVLRNGTADSPALAPGRDRVDPRAPLAVTYGTRILEVERGTTLLEAAIEGDVDLRSYCGGNCSCGTCRVEVLSGAQNLSRRQSMEEFALGMDAARRGDRLACQSQVLGPVTVRVPESF